MSKETQVGRLECTHRQIIKQIDRVQNQHNWRTNQDMVEASQRLTVEEAIILAEIAELKQSFPYMTAALECLHETRGVANQRVVRAISEQAIIASLTYPKYQDADADSDSDIGKFDTAFNRFATFLQSAAKIARVKLGLD